MRTKELHLSVAARVGSLTNTIRSAVNGEFKVAIALKSGET